MKNNFLQRVATSAVFVVVLIGSSILDPATFVLLFAAIIIIGLIEFYKIAVKGELKPQIITGIAFGLFIFASNFLVASNMLSNEIFAFYIPFLSFFMVIELLRNTENPFANISFTIFGALYVALPFGLISYLVYSPIFNAEYNASVLIALFVLIWAGDSGAYVIGSLIGKHKLFERISPKKTWEGFIGGALFALIAAYIISLYIKELHMLHWLNIALITIVFGTFGDLFESLLKRKVNLKDSGNILPGHGGILDRFDSLLLAAPVVFFYLQIFS